MRHFIFPQRARLQFQRCKICIPRITVPYLRNSRSAMLCKRRGQGGEPFSGDRFSFSDHLTYVPREKRKREGNYCSRNALTLVHQTSRFHSRPSASHSRVRDERRIKTGISEAVGMTSGLIAFRNNDFSEIIFLRHRSFGIFRWPFTFSPAYSNVHFNNYYLAHFYFDFGI